MNDKEILTSNFMGFDGFVWFFGIVEDRNDPLRLGRCKVRIFGVHPADQNLVTTDQLPWAMPIQPIYSAALAGVGHAPVGPIIGTIVFGFFLDGRDAQIPFMLGTVAGGLGHLTSSNAVPPTSLSNSTATQPITTYQNPPQNLITNTPANQNIPAAKLPQELVAKCKILAPQLMQAFGLTKEQAAGALGCMSVESNLSPNVINMGRGHKAQYGPPIPGEGYAYGYAQWLGPRKTAFIQYAASNNLNPQSDAANMGYLIQELKTSKNAAITNVKKITTTGVEGAAEAAKVWLGYFEFSSPAALAKDTAAHAQNIGATIPLRQARAKTIFLGLTDGNNSLRATSKKNVPIATNTAGN